MSREQRQPIRYHGALHAPYQAAPLALARDNSIGDAARSVALWLWSHADGYRISQRSVMAEMSKGQGSVKAAFEQLQAARWMVRQPIMARPNAPQPSGYVYHLTKGDRFTDADVERLGAPVVLAIARTLLEQSASNCYESRSTSGDERASRSDMAGTTTTAASESDALTVSKVDALTVSVSDAQRSASEKCKEKYIQAPLAVARPQPMTYAGV